MNRSFALAAVSVLSFAALAGADITLRTDVPGAASTVADPMAFDIFNNGGVPFRVNVTTITRGMTPAQKAGHIRAAVAAQAAAFLLGNGGTQNSVTLNNSAKKVKLVSDPTKEGFDKLNADSLALASFGGGGTSTGLDPDGNSSVIRCGIEGLYIAELNAPTSMTHAQILSGLRSLLNSNGVPAEINSEQTEITLTDMLGSTQNFVFGSTDTGFSMQAQLGVVPAPAAAGVLGALGLLQFRRRRR